MAAVTNRLLLRSVLERIRLRGRNLRNMLIVDTNSRMALPVWSLRTHAARIAAMCEEQVRNSQCHIERGFARIIRVDHSKSRLREVPATKTCADNFRVVPNRHTSTLVMRVQMTGSLWPQLPIASHGLRLSLTSVLIPFFRRNKLEPKRKDSAEHGFFNKLLEKYSVREASYMTSTIGVRPRDKSRLRSGLGASEPHRSQRIEAALFDAARDRSAKAALIDGSWSLDYGSLAEWAEQFAANLLARGLHRGDRVSMFFDKTPESVVALYGVWSAGGVAVPVNGGLRSRQLEYIVQHSGSKYFASTERKFNTLRPGILGNITRLEVEPLQEGSSRQATRPSGKEEEELAAILYTSGSTGRPKGVALSHANLCAGVRIVTRYLEIQEDERILSILPFSFDYGLNQLLTAVGQGATLVLHRSPLAGDICRSLTKHEITGLAGVPPLWIQLVQNRSPFSNMSFPRLRYVTNSGGAMPVDVVKALQRVLPNTKIYLMYGLTEAFRSTYLPPEEVDRRPDSIGKSIPECDILILSEGGGLCGPNEIGELVHRGPTVALGYWQDPEATAAKFRPNPFAPELLERVVYSGDLVKKDEEGFFYFVGRRDEMIKSLGYRISPTEVEEVIFESGLVAEVVVKGTPDPVAGQALVVHCIPAIPNTFSVQQLLAYCKKEMPSYMMPKSVAVHTMLPRTPSGKIDRKSVGT